MGTGVEQSGEFFPRASRTSRRHLEDMADSLHRLPSAAKDLQVIISCCNGTLLLQGEFCITLFAYNYSYAAPHYISSFERNRLSRRRWRYHISLRFPKSACSQYCGGQL